MNGRPNIRWNDQIRLVLSDVDETLAEVYVPAEPEMIVELSAFLQSGRKLLMVTGGSLERIKRDITDKIEPSLRQDILVSHCSGAEVWGFTESGAVREKPFYSIYEDTFTPEMKKNWREAIARLVKEFSLRTHPAQPKAVFWEKIGRHPLDIMLDDRGPQITMEVVNAADLTDEQMPQINHEVPLTHGKHDLRVSIQQRATQILTELQVPVTPRLAGTYALDFALEGVSKTTSIKTILSSPEILSTVGLRPEDLQDPATMEVWGDKFSMLHGGTDRFMSEALSPAVRSIDFREEGPAEFPDGYNIVIWNGQRHLHHGLQEYLQLRHLDK